MFLDKLFSQEIQNNLYFITSNSEDVATLQYSSFETLRENTNIIYNTLWKLDHDTLLLIDTLNYCTKLNTNLKHLIHQEEEGCFIFLEWDRMDWKYLQFHPETEENYKSNEYISILRYFSDSLELKKINIKNLPNSFKLLSPSNFLIDGNLNFKIGIDYIVPEYDYFLDKNGKFSHQKRLWDINNLYIKTESGAFERTYQRNRFPGGKDGKLKSGHSKDFANWEDAIFQGPYNQKDKDKYQGFTIQYKTPNGKYIIGKKDLWNMTPKDSVVVYWFMNKATNVWDTFKLNYFYPNFNVYNNEYIYGTGVNQLRYTNNTDTLSYLLAKNAKIYSDSLGLVPVIQTLTGKFFIYHFPTKTFSEFIGKSLDTEVIQIIDDWIYYREYDEIKKMKLDNIKHKFDIETNQIVVKDFYKVPMIHHMFYSKAFPKLNKDELFLNR